VQKAEKSAWKEKLKKWGEELFGEDEN